MFLKVLLLVAGVVVLLAGLSGCAKYDTTDRPGHHSGLKVYTDHATGVQYVQSVGSGELALRVDAEGKPYSDPRDIR